MLTGLYFLSKRLVAKDLELSTANNARIEALEKALTDERTSNRELEKWIREQLTKQLDETSKTLQEAMKTINTV